MSDLRFGMYVEFQCPPGRDHAELINDVIACAEHLDERGYHSFSTLEHPFFPKFAINVAPLPLFAKLAERTRNLRFRTLCHTLPLHNPMVLAGEIAETDILTGGRIDCGIGRGHGWLQEPANIPFEESLGRFNEAIEILIKGWTQERFDFEGKYYTCKNLEIVPKPLQKPHPPIYQVGTSSKSFTQAGQRGWSIVIGGPAPTSLFVEPYHVYIDACKAAGTKPFVGYCKALYLAEDEKTAMREAETAVMRFIEYNTSPLFEMDRPEWKREKLRQGGFHFYAVDDFLKLRDLSFQDLVDMEIVYVGTPEKVTQQFLKLYEQIRYDELVIISHYGGIDLHKAIKNQELFAREVAPRLKQAIAQKRKAAE